MKNNRRMGVMKLRGNWLWPVSVFLFLIITVTLFHYSVHIENALTLQPEPDFTLKPNLWRTIFEPLLGTMLYFNRSFYPLKELTVLLYWLTGIFLITVLVRVFLLKSRKPGWRYLSAQVVNLMILIGLWFLFFVLILFIPLPNDLIVNKTSDLVLVATHSHSEFSHDGLISQEGLVKWHQRNGFDAFYITDHNNHKQTLEFVNSRRNREIPGEPVVFCGVEFSGSNHLNFLGLKTDFTTKGWSDSVAVAKARSEGAAVIVNHWFDGERKTLEYYRDLGVDGFEIENTGEDKRYNREVYQRIKTFCEENGLIMNGGIDFHGYGSACTLWNAFQIPEWEKMDNNAREEAILEIIKSRDQSRLKVLLLNDRPYYDRKNLAFSPVITLWNYFRSLNLFQVASWVFWISLFLFVKNRERIAGRFPLRKLLPVAGMAGALFLISLGVVYLFRHQEVEGFTEIYQEYSRILFQTGFLLLIVSGLTAYSRICRVWSREKRRLGE